MKYIIILVLSVFTQTTHAITLTSTDITEGEMLSNDFVYNGFGCKGANKMPNLSWSDLPEGTKSLAITVYDPDAPTGSGWWHFISFNIPADATSLTADNYQAATNDYGQAEFGGACPPQGHGMHRYIFTLHALSVESLDVTKDTPPAVVRYMIHANQIDSASITAVYKRD